MPSSWVGVGKFILIVSRIDGIIYLGDTHSELTTPHTGASGAAVALPAPFWAAAGAVGDHRRGDGGARFRGARGPQAVPDAAGAQQRLH